MVSPSSVPSHTLFTITGLPSPSHLASYNFCHLFWEAFSDLFSVSQVPPLCSPVCMSARVLILLVVVYLFSWTVSFSRAWIVLDLHWKVTHSSQWCSEKGTRTPSTRGWLGRSYPKGLIHMTSVVLRTGCCDGETITHIGQPGLKELKVWCHKELRSQRQHLEFLEFFHRDKGTLMVWSSTVGVLQPMGRAHCWGKQGLDHDEDFRVGVLGRGLRIGNKLKR